MKKQLFVSAALCGLFTASLGLAQEAGSTGSMNPPAGQSTMNEGHMEKGDMEKKEEHKKHHHHKKGMEGHHKHHKKEMKKKHHKEMKHEDMKHEDMKKDEGMMKKEEAPSTPSQGQ